jgi:hypothetical protein
MKTNVIRLTAPAILLLCMFVGVVQSQTRRSANRRMNSSTQRLTPLTPAQKQTVSKFIERAKSLELTYQINPLDYITAAEGFDSFISANEIKLLPQGAVKTYLVSMVYGYADAATLLGTLTHTGLKNAFYGAQEAAGRNSRLKVIEDIGVRWRMNVLQVGLNQAQRRIFNNASTLKNKLISLLGRTPTLDILPSTESNEWTFPNPSMRGEYSDLTKTTMYDLGHGIFAGHIELVPGVPAVAMFLSVPFPKEEVSDANLALLFASKAVKLSKLLSDTVLEREKDSEYRFRTASGKVLIVALNPNREIAILRFE